MSYTPNKWQDHYVERPRTYTMTTNEDNTVTLTPAFGQTIQEGTHLDAENFNKLEKGLAESSSAVEYLYTTMQARIRALESQVEALEARIVTLEGA